MKRLIAVIVLGFLLFGCGGDQVQYGAVSVDRDEFNSIRKDIIERLTDWAMDDPETMFGVECREFTFDISIRSITKNHVYFYTEGVCYDYGRPIRVDIGIYEYVRDEHGRWNFEYRAD